MGSRQGVLTAVMMAGRQAMPSVGQGRWDAAMDVLREAIATGIKPDLFCCAAAPAFASTSLPSITVTPQLRHPIPNPTLHPHPQATCTTSPYSPHPPTLTLHPHPPATCTPPLVRPR